MGKFQSFADMVVAAGGSWVDAVLIFPNRHDYTTARVQLRREGMGTPLDLTAVNRRAARIAVDAWKRSAAGGAS